MVFVIFFDQGDDISPHQAPPPNSSPDYEYDLLQVDAVLRTSIDSTKLPASSAIVILNDSVLWNGNFGRRNGSDPTSPPINEYTIYRWVIIALHTYDFIIMLNLLLLYGLGVFHD